MNFEQNDWVRLLSIAEFAYNNAKNSSISHTLFELNCGYHSCVAYKEDIDSGSMSKLAKDLRERMLVCKKKLFCTQKLRKKAYNQGVKPRSYTLNVKVRLNSKYIKTKQNRKLENKFFRPF